MPKKKAYKALLHKCGGLLVVAKYLHFLAKPPCIALLVAWQGDGSGPTRAFLSLLVVKQDLQLGLAWSGQHQHSQCLGSGQRKWRFLFQMTARLCLPRLLCQVPGARLQQLSRSLLVSSLAWSSHLSLYKCPAGVVTDR